MISQTCSKLNGGMILPAFLGLALAVSMPMAANANGGGSSTSTVNCPNGEVYDKKQKKCVPEESSSLDQDSIYETGQALAYADKYEDAIRVLNLAGDQSDPRVLNMLGYSHRKSGNIDVALQYYQKAVAQNPDYSLVREYLGEAYIQLGMLEKAREQLSEIERICEGRTCDDYQDLATLIVDSQIQ